MNETSPKTFVIIDGNAIIHRAYHALPPMTTKDGTEVNAVYGFTSMLLKTMQDLKPDYLAVSFDVAGKTFRDELFEEYKAKRVKAEQSLYDQIPLVYQVVEAFGIPVYTKEGFEADDVIGTITKEQLTRSKEQVVSIVVTGDMDLLQLVDDDVTEVYLLRKGLSDMELYNEEKVWGRFGFGPERIIDYKALRGDTSDNIPGVPGIGEKTAKDLIDRFGGIVDLYDQIKNHKSKIIHELKPAVLRKLEEGEESAKVSKELATIRRDVPDLNFELEACSIEKLDKDAATNLLKKFEFYSLVKRLSSKEQGARNKEQNDVERENHPKKKKVKKVELIKVETKEQLKELQEKIRDSSEFVCREVLSGNDVMENELLWLLFEVDGGVYAVDVQKTDDQKKVIELFQNSKQTIIGHDLKQLVKALLLRGVSVSCQLFDVMIASYVVNSGSRAHDLVSVAERELGEMLVDPKTQTSLFGIDIELVAKEVVVLQRLYEKYTKTIRELDDKELFREIEMALIPVLAEMEVAGVAVDVPLLGTLSKEFADEVARLTKEICTEAGEEFNVASSVQLRDILFEKMGLPTVGIKKGKTGYSTAAPELEKLRAYSPIISLIEEHREITKLQNTYVDVLPALVNKNTGRIHTSFNQAVAATGRLSSSDPNLQNIPIRTKLGRRIRDAFICEPGNILIAADYSQIELRIVASLAEDPLMMEIFNKGEDIHQATAAAINGVKLEEVTKDMRRAAKEVNFGVLYGMRSFGLSSRTGMSQAEAKEFITTYFERFAGVDAYLKRIVAFAKKHGYVETLFGRRRYIPEIKSSNFQLRNAGERMAINMPVQGTAADVMKKAMIAVHRNIEIAKQRNNWAHTDMRMILQVHDEVVLEVKKGLEDEVGALVKREMQNVVTLKVPVEVDVAVGTRWGEMK